MFRRLEQPVDGVDDEVESAEFQRSALKILGHVDKGKTVLVRRYSRPRAVIMGYEEYKRLKALEGSGNGLQ